MISILVINFALTLAVFVVFTGIIMEIDPALQTSQMSKGVTLTLTN